jgi:hypothetical protein
VCDINSAEFQQVVHLAQTADDDLLALALTIVIRGAVLPTMVKRILLNAASCMLDAHTIVAPVQVKER